MIKTEIKKGSQTIVDTSIRSSKNKFSDILSGSLTNKLALIGSSSSVQTIDNDQKAIINEIEDMRLSTPLSTGIRPEAVRLLDYLWRKAVENGIEEFERTGTVVGIVSEYMKLCNLKDRKTATKGIKGDLISLYWTDITYTEKTITHDKQRVHLRLFRKAIEPSVIQGKFSLQFDKEAIYILARYSLMSLNDRYFQLGNTQRAILRKLTENTRTNDQRKQAGIIKVETLLKCTGLPSYATVMGTDKHISLRIIKPFLSAMDELEDQEIIEIEAYTKARSKPLTDEEYASLETMSYKDFSKLTIHYTITGYPEREELHKKKAEKAEKQKKFIAAKERAKAKKLGELEAVKQAVKNGKKEAEEPAEV